MENTYEAMVGGFTFLMTENVIEVWEDKTAEFAYSFIHLKDGEIKNEKQFQLEIMDWYSRNIG